MLGRQGSRSSAKVWRTYDACLAVSNDDIEFSLASIGAIPWADLLLNPRRLRGSDFLMRWSQGRWSEERVVRGVRRTGLYVPLPYGPSSTAPTNPREFELYFERLEAAGLGKIKRPDLLLVQARDSKKAERLVKKLGGFKELPFIRESNRRLRKLISLAVLAVECETSLWRSRQMPDYGIKLKPQRRLGGRLGIKKSAILPTVIVKDEDRKPLRRWERGNRVPIHFWHVFYDQAFGLSFQELRRLIKSKLIEKRVHTYQAPNGAITRKAIYKVPYLYAYQLGKIHGKPRLKAASITDKNGHVLPYVRFMGGRLGIASEALSVIKGLSKRGRKTSRKRTRGKRRG